MTIREAQELVEVWELKNGSRTPDSYPDGVAERFWEILSRASSEGLQLTDEFVKLIERKNSELK